MQDIHLKISSAEVYFSEIPISFLTSIPQLTIINLNRIVMKEHVILVAEIMTQNIIVFMCSATAYTD